MFELVLGKESESPKEFLFLGAHCDDIEIGCGGVILRLAEEFPEAMFRWVVLSSNNMRADEVRKSFNFFLKDIKNKKLIIQNFRNGYFPYIGASIKDYFEELKKETQPDVIFTHYGQDYHQDHRMLSDMTWNTFRNHFILEYEIPKYDGGLGSPNIFFSLDQIYYRRKVAILLECYLTELSKHWFTSDTFLGLMRLRGIESNSPSGYAEAFYCRKAII